MPRHPGSCSFRPARSDIGGKKGSLNLLQRYTPSTIGKMNSTPIMYEGDRLRQRRFSVDLSSHCQHTVQVPYRYKALYMGQRKWTRVRYHDKALYIAVYLEWGLSIPWCGAIPRVGLQIPRFSRTVEKYDRCACRYSTQGTSTRHAG